jgi:hypothetical protein
MICRDSREDADAQKICPGDCAGARSASSWPRRWSWAWALTAVCAAASVPSAASPPGVVLNPCLPPPPSIPVPCYAAAAFGFVKTANTGSGTVEVHVDEWNGHSYCRIIATTSDISESRSGDGTFGLYQEPDGVQLAFVDTVGVNQVNLALEDINAVGSYQAVLRQHRVINAGLTSA